MKGVFQELKAAQREYLNMSLSEDPSCLHEKYY